MELITIKSELEFLDAATKALAGELDLLTGVKFEGWPKLKLKVKGKRYVQTLPTNAMAGLVSLQDAYNRAYALTKYGTTNLQRLTEREKSDLEFVFKVSEGSTNNEAQTDGWLNSLIQNVGNVMAGMESIHKQRVLITLILVAGCYFIATEIEEAYTNKNLNKSSVALVAEVNRGHQQTIESLLKLSGNGIEEIKSVVGEGQVNFIKSVPDADLVEIDSVTVDKEAIQNITKIGKVAKNKREKQASYTIDGFKRSSDYLLFFVTESSTNESYSLKVDIGFTKQDELDHIFLAMKDGTEISLSVDLVVRGGVVEKGRLIKVIVSNESP